MAGIAGVDQMDKRHYREMVENLDALEQQGMLQGNCIYLFGHCNATEQLADILYDRGYKVSGILDNNPQKQGNFYRGIRIMPPEEIVSSDQQKTIVCIVARAYEAMVRQLSRLGFTGRAEKLIEYDSYADYSLSKETIAARKERLRQGILRLNCIEKKYPGHFRIYCPYPALGDVFLTMSYLPYFLTERHIEKCVVCVSSDAGRQVTELFGSYPVEAYGQKELDQLIQASLYTEDCNSFIAHQDRPYVVSLHNALYIKCIPLETLYKCGVFGLSQKIYPYRPERWKDYPNLDNIEQGRAVIFSPYAKSVTTFDASFWHPIVVEYLEQGYQCFTNVAADETPLKGTVAISPQIAEMKSVVERAGTFIGIRSGMCDVIRYAKCRKIALYPDYYYSGTRWKAIDMYALEGWENIVVDEDFVWKRK